MERRLQDRLDDWSSERSEHVIYSILHSLDGSVIETREATADFQPGWKAILHSESAKL